MKALFLAMAIMLAVAGCGKFEVYERNLQYLTPETLQAEKVLVDKQYQDAQLALAKAEASGNPEEIKKARAAFMDAKQKARAMASEERRRSRTW